MRTPMLYAVVLCGTGQVQNFHSHIWSNSHFRSLVVHFPDNYYFFFNLIWKPPFTTSNYQGTYFFSSSTNVFCALKFWSWPVQGVVERHLLLLEKNDWHRVWGWWGVVRPVPAPLLSPALAPRLQERALSEPGCLVLWWSCLFGFCILVGQTENWISHFTISLLGIVMSGPIFPLIIMTRAYLTFTSFTVVLLQRIRTLESEHTCRLQDFFFLGKDNAGRILEVKLMFYCRALIIWNKIWNEEFCDGK